MLPALVFLYIFPVWVVWLFHFWGFRVCCRWVWYGCPVFGSYLLAMAIALRACFLAWVLFLGVGWAVSAPSAYGAPVPVA